MHGAARLGPPQRFSTLTASPRARVCTSTRRQFVGGSQTFAISQKPIADKFVAEMEVFAIGCEPCLAASDGHAACFMLPAATTIH